MPITFEEVTASIQRDPQTSEASSAPAQKPGASGEDAPAELERNLRLIADRHARILAD
ncbi:hypothetical protein VVD49_06365 [Uliginosibacterium sp. H3]|uniref:Uncharacterized protein n=1 Tax=Uliginosibacterium silvisoli TaxID=3114758 RepID=A0ABU6K114_9RHOO|nr:hypothetical protein [Uliginosibacterium sp. H3]